MYIKSQTRADARGLVGAVLVGSITGLALGGVYLMGGLAQTATTHARVARLADGASGSFSDAAMVSAATRMDPGALAVAKRHDPFLFAALDQRNRQSAQLAARLEGAGGTLMPGQSGRTGPLMLRASFGSLTPGAAGPFQLGNALESSRELECLADAIYYEARGETPSGQAAVAQVVMNRVRHPAFPKSVCGVVFQGAYNRTGCQFSFACDGSMRRARDVSAWNRARKMAARTLAGDMSNQVGSATHFHTINVSPIWGPRLMRVAQVGMHIFYRFGRHGASSARVPTVEDIAPSEIASLTADGKPPVAYAASALGRLEQASVPGGQGGPIGPAPEPASAPIAAAVKALVPAADKAVGPKPIAISADRAPLDGLKSTVGAGSGAAS
ncbi:cell wall hydrolase [Caulobacter segnis]|uniref:Cell wall hydrolase SleB n=1 Tax=Caulobacter segnis (strain ATCC 21756 / DSM 7131 / JCM 7823 / NBRC 15250 / LMG 17158 / TK0059) TaxID=509190 RepID=D5VN17_CAUST|nr:cell wall hydrolase [Caulobacter segnis]ADG11890.1 cell wall hydrolase SleB [Caulobacter segnis ATCC 21756]